MDVLVHRAADVHQQQDLHLVVALGNELDVEKAGVGRRAVDRVVEVEFQLRTLAREAAQAAQRHLDVARAEFLGVVVVLVGALVPDLDRALVAPAGLADADALRVDAIGAER